MKLIYKIQMNFFLVTSIIQRASYISVSNCKAKQIPVSNVLDLVVHNKYNLLK